VIFCSVWTISEDGKCLGIHATDSAFPRLEEFLLLFFLLLFPEGLRWEREMLTGSMGGLQRIVLSSPIGKWLFF
jgi:hypothetical protein